MTNRLQGIWFILYLCLPLVTVGQVLHWTGGASKQVIVSGLMIYEDKTNGIDFGTASSPAFRHSFRPQGAGVVDFSHSSSTYWIRFTLQNDTRDSLLLELAQPLVADVSLFYHDPGRGWQSMNSGYRVNLYRKPVSHHYQLFPLARTDSAFYLRILANGSPIPIAIWKNDDYEIRNRNQKFIFGIYMGIMLFVILNNLFLFLTLRRIAYLHYSLLVFLYASFSALFEGYILYLFPNIDYMYWYLINPIVNQPNGLLYCIFFLEVPRFLPRLFKPALVLFLYFLSYIIWYKYLPAPVEHTVTQLHALAGILAMATLGILAGRKGNRLGYYFALAYFVFFVIAAIEVIYLQTGKPAHIFEISYVSIAIFTEVFFLLFLLSKRFQWEKDEMERARAESSRLLLEKTRENERIVREQNVVLEEKVKERTFQLELANDGLNRSLKVIETEKQKSDTLLLNILPEEVAEELKQKGSADARLYEHVTVLFTDFVNFTTISEKLGPRELVNKIDFFFKRFDAIIEKHGLEKIKTIGDAYLAVSGLPKTDDHNAEKVAWAAIEINRFIREEGGEFRIRIGIHSGPVVAGIVGVKKFAYDIWGDTVNIAARMEQASETGKINMSGDTYNLLKDQFICTYRGKIRAKNKGEIDMYFLEEWTESP